MQNPFSSGSSSAPATPQPVAYRAVTIAAIVLGMITDRIDRDDDADGLPASLDDACRRHRMPGPAEKAPRADVPFDRLTPACVGVRTAA